MFLFEFGLLSLLIFNRFHKLNIQGDVPKPRESHATVVVNDMMIIYGGLGLEEENEDQKEEEKKDNDASKASKTEDPPKLNDFYVLTGL